MKKLKYILLTGFLALSVLFHPQVIAQTLNTPASIELTNSMALWINTQNAAGLAIDKMSHYNEVSLFYGLGNGKYKLCADGEKERLFGFNTNGALSVGQMFLWGDFSYKDEFLSNTQFNTNQIKVRRDVPYYVVDPNLSDWMRRTYQMNMKVASQKLFNLLFLGINAEYQNNVGAKQVDPRSTVYSYDMNVKPSVIFAFTQKHHIGLTGIYYNYKSNSTTVNSDNQVSQTVYILKGLGYNYIGNVGGLSSLNPYFNIGNRLGGELGYSYNTAKMDIVVSAGYSKKVEDVAHTPTRPRMEGSTIEKNQNVALQLLMKGHFLHKLMAVYNNNQIDGVEYIQELDRTYEVQRWITKFKSIRSSFKDIDFDITYDFIAKAGNEYNWKVGAFFNYHKLSDIYYLPLSTMDYRATTYGVDAKYNFHFGANSRLLIGVNGALKSVNDDAKYVYGGPNPESPIIKDFMEKDFAMATNGNTKFGGEATFSTPVSKTKFTSLYFKLACDYYKASKIDVSRTITHFSLGLTF